jgi:hypothetical protein
MADKSTPSLGFRLRHYQGQRLQAADLQDEYDNLTSLRGLHVIGLHNTWGIALGFTVQMGSKGSNTVGIAPGLAYDARGHEIVLTSTRPVGGPQGGRPIPDNTPITLVMRYDEDLGQREAGREWAPCTDNGDPPGRERPLFAWKQADAVQLGLDVPLLSVRLQNGRIDEGSLDLSVRHYAQAQTRPHIAAGLTPKEQVWELWQQGSGEQAHILGLQTWVDTRDAGFVGTPYYEATLVLGGSQASSLALLSRIFLIPSVAEERAGGFRFRLLAALGDSGLTGNVGFGLLGTAVRSAARQPAPPVLQVSWLGVEPVDGCAPPPRWEWFRRLIERRFVGTIATPSHLNLFTRTNLQEPNP